MTTIDTDFPLMTSQSATTRRIARFWDQVSPGWKALWGIHIHHGFYENDSLPQSPIAEEKLIDELTKLVQLKKDERLLDAGCGMGGSSIYLAKHYGAKVAGITLSAKQVALAENALAHENDLTHRPHFKVADALNLSDFAAGSFDVVWSLESCEQFFNKSQFIKEAYRVLAPGGRLMIATWCSSNDRFEGRAAKKYKALCHAFDLPYMPTLAFYKNCLKSHDFKVDIAEDWSEAVCKSWDIGIKHVAPFNFFKLIKMGGWRGWRFVRQLQLMQAGFRDKSVRYGVFVASKPNETRI